MTKSFFQLLLIILLLTPGMLFSESEPCIKIKEENAKLDCFKKEFEKKDKKLNEIYKDLKSKIKKPLAKAMKLESRSWIDQKEYFCTHEIYTQDKEAINKNSSYYSCLIDFTDSRIDYLRKAFGRENVKPGMLGEYSDGSGGQLIIKKENDKNAFSLSVSRGPTVHVGEISGYLKLNAKEYRWKDKQEGETCELNFSFSEYTITVKEIECSTFHGANAYFDGTYRKIK